MRKIAKISEETFEDLEAIRGMLIMYGTQKLSPEAQQIIACMKKDKLLTYKGLIAASVKVLRVTLEKLNLATK